MHPPAPQGSLSAFHIRASARTPDYFPKRLPRSSVHYTFFLAVTLTLRRPRLTPGWLSQNGRRRPARVRSCSLVLRYHCISWTSWLQLGIICSRRNHCGIVVSQPLLHTNTLSYHLRLPSRYAIGSVLLVSQSSYLSHTHSTDFYILRITIYSRFTAWIHFVLAN